MGKNKFNILNIGHDIETLKLIADILGLLGNGSFELATARDLQRGLERLGEKQFDVILLELELPDSKGLDTLKTLLRKGTYASAVIVIGPRDESLAEDAIALGAQDCLAKNEIDVALLKRSMCHAIKRQRILSDYTLFQETMQKHARMLQLILDNIEDAVVVMSHEGKTLFFNPAAKPIVDAHRAERSDKNIEERGVIYHEDKVTPYAVKDLPLMKAVHGELIRDSELYFREPHKIEGIWLSVNARPLRAEQGEICGGVAVFRDITERKKTEDNLKQSQLELIAKGRKLRETLVNLESSNIELKTTQDQLVQAAKLESIGRLAAGTAHEVKNPLAILQQGIYYISNKIKSDDPKIAKTLKYMDESIMRADAVVKGLLDFSNVSDLEKNPEDCNSIIESALLLVKHDLDKHHVKLSKHFTDKLPPVNVDLTRIQQVLVNLFSNAISAMPEGGTLEIKTSLYSSTKGQGTRVEIEDTGSGIPVEVLNKVFDPFFTTRLGRGGTGLGLSIVRNIMEMHEGKIEISNKESGQGARVELVLRS